MHEDNEAPSRIGWPRAVLTSAIIVVVAVVVLVYGSNAILTDIHGKTRSSLVAIVTTLFFALLIALAWALRQLQRRKII
jgi:hypothetical protein